MDRFRRRMETKAAREAERLSRIQRRFGNVHRRHNRGVAVRRGGRFARRAAPLFLVAFAALFAAFAASPFPPLQSLRHLAAAPTCSASRAVGLQAAPYGAAGYWTWNDQDLDGIACEPLPPAQTGPGLSFYNCAAVRAVDAAPIRRGSPGFADHLDPDGDGIGCELDGSALGRLLGGR